jgi:hypothetical protein
MTLGGVSKGQRSSSRPSSGAAAAASIGAAVAGACFSCKQQGKKQDGAFCGRGLTD